VLRTWRNELAVNTAGSPITNLERIGGFEIITLKKNMLELPDWYGHIKIGHVNEDTIRIKRIREPWDRYTVMFRRASWEETLADPEDEDGGIDYITLTVELWLDREGWYARPQNMGLYEKVAFKEYLHEAAFTVTPGPGQSTTTLRQFWSVNETPTLQPFETYVGAIRTRERFKRVKIAGDLTEPVWLDADGKRPRIDSAGNIVPGPLTETMKLTSAVKEPLDPSDLHELEIELQEPKPFRGLIEGVY
jgi:hypothetical protein